MPNMDISDIKRVTGKSVLRPTADGTGFEPTGEPDITVSTEHLGGAG